MTEHERALWAAAQADYTHALAIANKAWERDAMLTDDATIQAATATILIHITKLRSEERIHVKVPPSSAAPAAVKRDGSGPAAASQAPVAVPPCPQCGGEMWDNRGKKKNPKSADFTCKQKNGECVNEKGFKTGVWAKDLTSDRHKFGVNSKPGLAGATAIRDEIDSYATMPAALGDGEDSLPF